MKDLPTKLDLELEDRDIEEDITKIVDSMQRIRLETLKEGQQSDEQKDGYLHAVCRLASGIDGLRQDNEELEQRINFIAETLKENPELNVYDPLQDSYWETTNPRFIETLDNILITVMKDDFKSLDHRHHILQAIEYLNVKDASFEEKEKIFDQITPFHGRLGKRREGIFKYLLGKLFGYSYSIEKETDLVLKIKGCKDLIPEAMKKANDLGYTFLQIDMFHKDFEKIKEQFPEAHIVNRCVRKKDKFLGLIPYDKEKWNDRAQRFTNQFIRFTKFPFYPIYGALPRSLQERLSRYVDRYNEESSSITSWITFVLGGCVFTVLGLAVAVVSDKNTLGALYLSSGGYLMVESAIRIKLGNPHNKFEHPVGTVPFKILFYPTELGFRFKDRMQEKKAGLGDLCTIEFKLRDLNAQKNNYENVFNYFKKAAEINVPESLEKNLIYRIHSHHSFGKRFDAYFKEQAEAIKPKTINFKHTIDKKNQYYLLKHKLKVGDYQKVTALVCGYRERYVLSYIYKAKPADIDNDLSAAAEILKSEIENEDKAEQITEKLKTKYTHLLIFENGELKNDFETR